MTNHILANFMIRLQLLLTMLSKSIMSREDQRSSKMHQDTTKTCLTSMKNRLMMVIVPLCSSNKVSRADLRKLNIEQLIGGGDDLLGAIVNHPNFANRFNEARIQRAAQRPVSIVSNLQQDEEEKNNGNQAQGGIVWWVWSTVKSVAWGIIEFVKYIFAKEDTSGMISGEEFKRIFSERLN